MLPAGLIERIRSILRGELCVTLSQSDGSAKNQDALEVLQEILFDAERERETPVGNLEAWAVSIAENRIADYLRAARPRHFSIRNRLRYFVRHLPGYAEASLAGGRVAGPALWITEERLPADAIDVAMLVHQPSQLRFKPPGSGDFEEMNRADWDRLLTAVFGQLRKPVLLNDLAAIICAVFRIEEVRTEPVGPHPDGELQVDPPDPRPAIPDLESREILCAVWAEIVDLLPRQRIALLLNLGDDGDPLIFSESQVVSEAEICRALGLTPEQYRLALIEALGDSERCRALLRHLPLADLTIARLLGATRDQVIGLRRKARERLARRIGYRGGNMSARSTPSSGRST